MSLPNALFPFMDIWSFCACVPLAIDNRIDGESFSDNKGIQRHYNRLITLLLMQESAQASMQDFTAMPVNKRFDFSSCAIFIRTL